MIGQLFPSYQGTLDRKRVTYRPFQRNNTQALHIDSSYGYPTQGRGMLRIFSNIHPTTRPRIWQLGEPFEPFVRRFLPSVRLKEPSLISSILARLGIVDGTKTKYDQYIAALRALGMRDKEYQQTAPQQVHGVSARLKLDRDHRPGAARRDVGAAQLRSDVLPAGGGDE